MENKQPYPAIQPSDDNGRKKRDLFQMGTKDFCMCGVLLILTVFGVAAGVWGGFRLGFALAYGLFFLAVSLYLAEKKQRPGMFGTVCGVLAVITAPVFVLTSNAVIRGFCVIGGTVLSAIWFAALSDRRPDKGDLGLIRLLFDVFSDAPKNMPRSMRSVFSGGSERTKSLSKILLGAVCAIPVLCVVVPLLIRSDAAFEGMVSALFSDVGTVAAQLIISILLAPFAVAFALSLKKERAAEQKSGACKGVDTAFLTTFTTVLCVVYACYLGSQLAYFFDAFRGLLPQGYENAYADYARRGFFELCAVAGINLAILLLGLFLAKKKEEKPPVALRIPSTFIILFTLVLIGTALAKMRLYIGVYGLTVLRLGTSAFMVFMAVVFLSLLGRMFLAKVKVVPTAVLAAAVVLLILGLGNINGFVAKYNYDAYVSGKLRTVDTDYLYSLGPEGAQYILQLCENETAPRSVRREAAEKAYILFTTLYDCEYEYVTQESMAEKGLSFNGDRFVFHAPLTRTYAGISKFNLPLQSAYAAADAFLARYPDFLERQGNLYAKGSSRGYFDPEEPTTAALRRDD